MVGQCVEAPLGCFCPARQRPLRHQLATCNLRLAPTWHLMVTNLIQVKKKKIKIKNLFNFLSLILFYFLNLFISWQPGETNEDFLLNRWFIAIRGSRDRDWIIFSCRPWLIQTLASDFTFRTLCAHLWSKLWPFCLLKVFFFSGSLIHHGTVRLQIHSIDDGLSRVSATKTQQHRPA